MAIFFLLVLSALLGPVLSPYPAEQSSGRQFSPPTREHWFGTDVHGRDLFTRVTVGARWSLLVAAAGTVISAGLGVSWGMVAGYAGGRLDHWMMRVVDILYSLPNIVFVIVLTASTEGLVRRTVERWQPEWSGSVRLGLLVMGLGAVSWLTMARIVRGQVLSLKNQLFVLASRSLGASPWRILWWHLFPNVRGIVVAYLALTVPALIMYESFLSYLGLGVRPPQASLGTLLAEGASQLNGIRAYWWMLVMPGAVLGLLLFSLNQTGEGLRQALNSGDSERV